MTWEVYSSFESVDTRIDVTSEEPGMSPPGIIVVGPERPGSGLYLNATLCQLIRVRVEDMQKMKLLKNKGYCY